jgi:hypothetical protein
MLLHVYPRAWRERYGDELVALLEAEPLTWRVRLNVIGAGIRERLRGSGPAELRVLWAWSLFVIGGMAFQKTSEHWQSVVPGTDRAIPTAAFDIVQGAAIVGSAAVVIGVALVFPAFIHDLRSGGWTAVRRPIVVASAATVIACCALIAVAVHHDVVAASVFIAAALVSLFAWTHAASVAARRLPRLRAHRYLARFVGATMLVMTVAAAVWFGAVSAHAPSFVAASAGYPNSDRRAATSFLTSVFGSGRSTGKCSALFVIV